MAKTKGHPQSMEARKKISDFQRGRHQTEEHKRKIGEANKGNRFSEEIRKKLSALRMGHFVSLETKKKISKAMKKICRNGDKNPFWKGGTTPMDVRIRGSGKYTQWRQQIYLRDNFTCQKCGDATSGNLIAHHKKSFRKILKEIQKQMPLLNLYDAAVLFAELWDINNGVTLCRECHRKIHKNRRTHGAITDKTWR